MACKYHPNAISLKKCENCGSNFCNQCSKTTLCLDCATAIAKKMIVRSYIAAGIGFVLGLIGGIQGRGASALFSPIIMAYAIWGTYLVWRYVGIAGWWLGHAMDKFGKFVKAGEGYYIFALAFLVGFRLTASLFLGIFGGGIAVFLWCRSVVKRQRQFAMSSHSAR
jgi:hypothetical protein